MKIGIIGLGKMGNAIAYRLLKNDHDVFGYDSDKKSCDEAKNLGVLLVASLQELVKHTTTLWLMLPAGDLIDNMLKELLNFLPKESIIVDGGNSKFIDSIRRATFLQEKNIFFIDCGTSGGLAGREHGFSLMIGGEKKIFTALEPLFQSIAAPQGYAYIGPSGTGHYVKMIHNGIEYALMQAYAEGFHLLKDGYFKDLDLAKIADVWLHGSIIRSWLLHLAYEIFKEDQTFETISGYVAESGMGKWTVEQAHLYKIPVPVIEDSLAMRFWSKESGGNYATKIIALLRHKMGGHGVKKK